MSLDDWGADLLQYRGLWELQIADGRRFGPVPRATLDQWMREGRIGVDSLLRREREPLWSRATRLYPHLTTGHGHGRGPGVPTQAAVNAAFSRATNAGPTSRPLRYGTPMFLAVFGFFCCMPLSIFSIILILAELNLLRNGTTDRRGLTGLIIAGIIAATGLALQITAMFGSEAVNELMQELF